MKIINDFRFKKNIKKENKRFNEKVRIEKNGLNNAIKYLVDLYYNNPNNKITFADIKMQVNISDECLKLFIEHLRNRKLIKGKKKFLLTFDGLIYLQELERGDTELKFNGINTLVGYGAFTLMILGVLYSDSSIIKFMSIIFVLIIVFLICEIVSKK
jgi:hypothetical protein